ncbi:hypothetical protein Pelo_17061 [Pelomyxa schiedti]|nr:hypothetical protein Pelo_17061 [Pelomyxa schiedti]
MDTATRTTSDMVRLNVGGQLFITTRTTLSMTSGSSTSSSFFTVLLSGKLPSTMDETGAFFIDRNGKLFAPILDFMRTGLLFVPPTLNTDAVYNEAEYYQIQLPERVAPSLLLQRPPVVHDYVVIEETTWNSVTCKFGTVPNWSIITQPTNSDLKELLNRLPREQSIANLVTEIEAHSSWRVKSWKAKTDPECKFTQSAHVYLYKPLAS